MIEEIIAGAELVKAIGGTAQSAISEPEKPSDEDKFMTVTLKNCTQFPLIFKDSDMEHGKFWKTPTNVEKFNDMTFSVCPLDGSFLTGMQGGALFELQMPKKGGGYETSDISVGFDDPAIGSNSCSVYFSSSVKKSEDHTKYGTMSDQSTPLTGKTKDGKEVKLSFLGVSTPGKEVIVTITQQVEKG